MNYYQKNRTSSVLILGCGKSKSIIQLCVIASKFRKGWKQIWSIVKHVIRFDGVCSYIHIQIRHTLFLIFSLFTILSLDPIFPISLLLSTIVVTTSRVLS